jgi:serine/threonine-protein kinase
LHPRLRFRVFEQLKQRNVFRVAILYLVVCWLILEPVHVIFHMLEVPVWANRLVILLMAFGFPAMVIFAWVYEISPEGLKVTAEVPHGQSIRRLTGQRLDRAIMAVLALALAYFLVDKFGLSRRPLVREAAPSVAQNTVSPASTFTPPPRSVAVLPFVNISGDKEQEYFSDGLTEELLNSLSRINELRVTGRTSSFYFKGEHVDLSTIAHKLNVAAILEGSVRRSGHTVRITAELIDAVSGFHLWTQTYDRDLRDMLKLQSEIADSVASSLQVTLLGDVAAKIGLGGTHSPAAFDAYLRASKVAVTAHKKNEWQTVIAAYSEAIRLDPNYALAFAGRSRAFGYNATEFETGRAVHASLENEQLDARRAIAMAPDLAEAHSAMAFFFERSLDFTQAMQEYERAMALAPGNAQILRLYGGFGVNMGRTDVGLAAARRAVSLDPLNLLARESLGVALFFARRYDEAIAALQDALTVDPKDPDTNAFRGFAYYTQSKLESAFSSCNVNTDQWQNQTCLAVTYDKLGRHIEAEAVLAKMRTLWGDAEAYQYAQIYAQWGNRPKALDWLETALRLHDAGFIWLKVDPLLDSLREEPRFQAIERALKFPK